MKNHKNIKNIKINDSKKYNGNNKNSNHDGNSIK